MKNIRKRKENGELYDKRKQVQTISSNNEKLRDRELKRKIAPCTRYFTYTTS
jgi:hypothetical protein